MAQEERVHMGLSVKAMIFHAGRLLVLQKNDSEGLHHWEFPGGGLRRDEDFAMAVCREVMEETGLSIQILATAGTWSYQKKDGQFLNGVIFTAVTDKEDVRLSHEHCDYRWVTPEEFRTCELHGSLRRSLDRMQEAKVVNHSLTNFDVIADVAAKQNYIRPEDVARLIQFRNDPSDESWIGGKN